MYQLKIYHWMPTNLYLDVPQRKFPCDPQVGFPSTKADPNQLDFYVILDGLVSDVSNSGGRDAAFTK